MPVDSREELNESPVESRDLATGGLEATRTWICDWEDRYHVRGLLCDPPELYPYTKAFEAYVQAVSVSPWGNQATSVDTTTGLLNFKKAKIVAKYSSASLGRIQPDTDPENPTELISETLEPTVEFLTMDHRGAVWEHPYKVADVDPNTGVILGWKDRYDLQAEQAPGFQLYGEIYTLIRHNVKTVHPDVRKLSGTCNQYPITPKTFGIVYPAQSLLYMKPDFDVSRFGTTQNLRKTSVTMKFHYRNIPSWNMFWRPDLYDGTNYESSWDKIMFRRGAGFVQLIMYPPADWKNLFKAVQA